MRAVNTIVDHLEATRELNLRQGDQEVVEELKPLRVAGR